jgi:Tfp pilus assembly protein PilF
VRWIERTGIVGAVLFVTALAVRLIYLWESASGATFLHPVVDSETYDRLARALAAGEGLTYEYFWQPVFYPFWLGTVFRLSGGSIVAAKLLQALVGALTVLLSYRLGRQLFGAGAGLLAGALLACYGPAIFFDGELLATGWATFWSVLLLLLFPWAASRGAAAALLLGACGAAAILTRPTFLPFVLAGCGWLWLQRKERRWLRPAAALAGLALILTPVSIASKQHSGRLSFLPASGGLNLFIGNNPDFERTIAIRPGADWRELTQSPRRHGVTERRETGRHFQGRVVDYVLEEPVSFVRGLLAKTGHLLSSRELARNVDLYLFREESGLLSLLVWKVGSFGFPFGLLLPLAAVGIALCRHRLSGPLVAYLALYPAAIVLVFVSARYRTPLAPVLAVVAAGGLFELCRAAAGRRSKQLLLAAAVALPCLALSLLPGPYPQERANHRAELQYFLGTRALNAGDLALAGERLEGAIELEPAHSDAHNQLGLVRMRQRRFDEAVRHLEASIRHNPRSVIARTNLARLYAARRRFDEAFREFEAALAHDPYEIDAHRYYGLTLLQRGRREQAARHLQIVLEVRPEDEEVRRALVSAGSATPR